MTGSNLVRTLGTVLMQIAGGRPRSASFPVLCPFAMYAKGQSGRNFQTVAESHWCCHCATGTMHGHCIDDAAPTRDGDGVVSDIGRLPRCPPVQLSCGRIYPTPWRFCTLPLAHLAQSPCILSYHLVSWSKVMDKQRR